MHKYIDLFHCVLQTQQIEYYGYPVEIHEVTTDDGYILQLHRIPYGLDGNTTDNKTVVFLMPGLLCSSGVFVINGRNKSLAYILADLNYDVWIGNGRGTVYSRKHVTLDPDTDKAEFFNFTYVTQLVYFIVRNVKRANLLFCLSSICKNKR